MTPAVELRAPDAIGPSLEHLLRALCQRCAGADGAPPRVHWSLGRAARHGVAHRVAVLEGELAGFGVAYRFAPEEAELVVAVDPRLRGRGVGRVLRGELEGCLRRWGAPSWLIYVPAKPPQGAPEGSEGPSQPLREELRLLCDVPPAPGLGSSRVRLREAGIDDFSRLAILDAESFGSDPAVFRARLCAHHDGVRRRAYFAEVEDVVVGKIHLRDDGEAEGMFAHDLCVRPSQRGLGHGAGMVAAAARLSLAERNALRLEVEADNLAAIATYRRVGFRSEARWALRRFAAGPA